MVASRSLKFHFQHLVLHLTVHESDLVSHLHRPVHYSEEHNHSTEVVVVTVEDQCTQWLRAVSNRSR